MVEDSNVMGSHSHGNEDNDLDSLFGGDDDTELTSHFMEAESAGSSPHPDSERASPPSQEHLQEVANLAAQLSFPQPQAQVEPSDQGVLAVPQLSLPAVPDPLEAFLSHQDGLTSGDNVVSSQNLPQFGVGSNSTTAWLEQALDDAALEADLQSLWDTTYGEELPVDAPAGNQPTPSYCGDAAPQGAAQNNPLQVEGDLEDNVILPSQIPGFRYGQSRTNSCVRLPRRIDVDAGRAEELVYYITLNRRTKPETLYGYLELSPREGKRLSREITQVLNEPSLAQLVEQPSAGQIGTKRTLIHLGLNLLIDKGWGNTWFCGHGASAAPRTHLWPRDSSILLISFALLLYRHYVHKRQMYQTRVRQIERMRSELERSPSVTESPPPSVSPLSVDASSPLPSSSASYPSPTSPATSSQCASPTPEGESCLETFVKEVIATKQRKHLESDPLSASDPFEVEVPAGARLEYHIYVKDRTDERDLAPPMTYRHTDHVMRGAFSNLKASFEAAGHEPVFFMQTPVGRKRIDTEGGWDHAVCTIYNNRRSGGVVEVDVYL